MRSISMFGLSDVKIEGTLQYKGGGRPKETSRISVSLTEISCSCELELLDSCYISTPESQHIYGEATSLVDRAFDKALCLMVDGEVALISVVVPKNLLNEHVLDDVSLTCKAHLKIIESGKSVFDFSDQEKLILATKYKNMGVELYKKGATVNHMSAYLFFCQAVKWLVMIEQSDADSSTNDVKSVKMQCYNNISLYHLNQKNYLLVVTAATKVLKVESTNVKARYRRAVANTELQNYEEAEEDLRVALGSDPNNGPVKKQQEELRKRQKAVSQQYATAMKKFLS